MSDLSIQNPRDSFGWNTERNVAPSVEQEKQLKELKSRDTEVRAHEQAHLAASGGAATGGAHFTYQAGPDGKRYATGGEVNIRIRSGRTPEETLRNAQQVERAAMAPAKPSGQDLQVAASARRMEVQARREAQGETADKDKSRTKIDKAYVPSAKGSAIDVIA